MAKEKSDSPQAATEPMLHSAEIRWFFPETDLGCLEALFPKSAPSDEMNWEESRTDVYFVVPGAAIMGLKMRKDQKLELKALRAAPEVFHLPPNGSRPAAMKLGRADFWVKWELPGTQGNTLLPDAIAVPVAKRRWVRKFMAEGGRIERVPAHGAASSFSDGCNVERTEISAGNERWLTLGFEAFGKPSRIRETLFRAIGLVMDKATPAELRKIADGDSLNYPGWLEGYLKRGLAGD